MMFGRNAIAAAAVVTLAGVFSLAEAFIPTESLETLIPAALLPLHGAAAQTLPSLPSVDADGTCPREDELVRLNPAIDGSIRSLRQRTGSPVRQGLPLYRYQSLTGPQVSKPASGYDDDIVVMIGAKLGTAGPALVKRIRDNVCGWMDVRDLTISAMPLKLIQVPGFEHLRGQDSVPDRMEARVIPKTRIDRETGNPQPVPVFSEPFDGPEPPAAERRSDAVTFEVLSVFEVRRRNGRCRTIHEDGCFLRVGTAAELGSQSGGRARGWMLGKDLDIWPSPLAVYYKLGTEGLKIHAAEYSARIGTPFATPGAEARILAHQPPGRYAEPRDVNVMRFPVIRGTLAGRPPRPGEPWTATPIVYEIMVSAPVCLAGRSNCRQAAQNGFIFQNGPDGDFRYWLGFRRPEFSDLRESVRGLCESLPYGEKDEYIEDAVLKLVQLMTFGDPRPGQNQREYVARVFGVPADHISATLEGTPEQFVRRLGRPGERAGLIARVCRSARLLDMAAQDETVDDPIRDIAVVVEGASLGRTSLRPDARPRPFDWRWRSPGTGSEWFFVPLDYLP
jgi:hypothetical protein